MWKQNSISGFGPDNEIMCWWGIELLSVKVIMNLYFKTENGTIGNRLLNMLTFILKCLRQIELYLFWNINEIMDSVFFLWLC